MPQGFLAFLAARSLFFSKITLILTKKQGDRFVSDCFRHHPVLCKPQIPAPPLNRPFL